MSGIADGNAGEGLVYMHGIELLAIGIDLHLVLHSRLESRLCAAVLLIMMRRNTQSHPSTTCNGPSWLRTRAGLFRLATRSCAWCR
jgi:hypothetical protein